MLGTCQNSGSKTTSKIGLGKKPALDSKGCKSKHLKILFLRDILLYHRIITTLFKFLCHQLGFKV